MAQHSDKRSRATVTGKVAFVSSAITRGKFTYREVIVTEDGKYPNPIAVEFSGEHIDKPSDLGVGDEVTIACNVRGREWTSPQGEVKHFLSLSGWLIEYGKRGASPAPIVAGPEDDLPF